jgi:TetR/AcrR family transcriptional regulator
VDELTEAGSKEKILKAARTEFAQYGLDGARVDRIADEAGLNKAMIYYHFTSKENLYNEVIRSYFQRAAALMRQRGERTETIEQHLEAIADAHIDISASMPEFKSILLRELANPRDEVLDMIASALIASEMPAQIKERFESGVRNGRLRPVNGWQTMTTFIAASIGFLIMFPIFARVGQVADDERFIQERKKTMIDIFMNGLKAR